MLIDASSGHHNLNVMKKSSYLTILSCPFGMYRYIKLPFGTAPAGDMFKKKMDELFNEIPNVTVIDDDILF